MGRVGRREGVGVMDWVSKYFDSLIKDSGSLF